MRFNANRNVVTGIKGCGAAPLLLSHVRKSPIEGGLVANTIVGVKGGYKPVVVPASSTPLQSITPPPLVKSGGDLLNSISFAKNMRKNQKRDNIKFNF